ncbi:hypothetical protein MTP09_09105 [Chryseobacterium suipulveris]|uniref:Uncharacterized protein n=1 Tax=Chryseobacterium suipulveris TaxID=2929800 RepID=A0ABY4BQU0_9FLAO|nr:hypothetical protein [Chryseobacterium suipulveris]UOE40078.1 hypothetical protein MTP09_09105 [Chryseobacterium suipulveris]
MKKLISILAFLVFCTISAQRVFPMDSLKLKDANDLFADDYGNLYLYKNKDFSLTKYDSLGKQTGKLLLTLPFKIQSVQNPLNIPLFSENAQELKFYDQNLNLIQTVNFRQKFGFIKMVYAEDLQQIWLLDESTKRLIQYNFRQDAVSNSFALNFSFDEIVDMLVFENRLYLLKKENLTVFEMRTGKSFQLTLENGRKLRRENENILVIGQNQIQSIENGELKTIFKAANSAIVDKNSATYFEVSANKLYLYQLEKAR